MKLGISMTLPHSTPEEWAEKHKSLGLTAVIFPCSYKEKISKIDEYVAVCKEHQLTIAEVGAWKNILTEDVNSRKENFEFCKNQLELADYVKAKCCVNIAGAKGEVWDGGYAENYSERTYNEIVQTVQRIIDEAKLKYTFYTLEPMPWMYPDSPENYLKLIEDINREQFAVHMDMVNMICDPKKYLFNKDYTTKAFQMLGKYIKSCHIKDVALGNSLTVLLKECPLGEGGFDLKNYIRCADELDADMPMIIEHLGNESDYINAIKYINSI